MRHIVLATVLALGLLSANAHAEDGVYWSAAATTCTPDNDAIQGDRYSSAVSYVDHIAATGTLNSVDLYCSVPPNDGEVAPNLLIMRYLDSDGSASCPFPCLARTNVTAGLWAVSRSTGSSTLITSLSSSSFAETTSVENAVEFSHSFDWGSYNYFVAISMQRKDLAHTARANYVALEYGVP